MSTLERFKKQAEEYPAPWEYNREIGAILGPDGHAVVSQSDDEGAFIAEMRNMLPKLLDVVDAGKQAVKDYSHVDYQGTIDVLKQALDEL